MGFVIGGASGPKESNQQKTRQRRAALKALNDAQSIKSVRNDLLPKLEIEVVPIDDLKVAKRRLRKKDEKQIARVEASLKTFGQSCPVLLNKFGTIVDGHIVVEAARRLGLPHINCVRLHHLSAEEARLLSIALNRIQECGEWDVDELAIELIELETLNFDLSATGFTVPELDGIMMPADPDEGADQVPEVSESIVTKIGDLWQCGPHRVLCASATEKASYDRLMDGKQAAATVSDPPYNTKIKGQVSGLGKHKHEDFIQASGEMSSPQFQAFLEAFLINAAGSCAKGAVIFAFMDWRMIHLLRGAADEAKLHHINTIVWDKGSGAMGALYRSAHELIGVFCTAKSPALNNVQLGKHGRDRTNVQHYPGANQPGSSAGSALALHATPKPVELIADLILDVSEPGNIILDPFLGSGTALIAAQSAGRIVYGAELDPKFVDVTIKRWEQWTGQRATLADDGRTFSEIAAARSGA